MLAFSQLVGLPFDEAVDKMEPEVRLRGPLWWRVEEDIADAQTCEPWVGLPALSLQQLGSVQCTAKGLLVIENLETFEQVCRRSKVHERWLCLWSGGYANNGLIKLLRSFELPIAAWCDLDVDGIAIVADLERRTGRPVHPVGMDVAVYDRASRRGLDEHHREDQRRRARRLTTDGPRALRRLAARLASSGFTCEQEALHFLIPLLGEQLVAIEQQVYDHGCTTTNGHG
jgi:hypothetical protein